MPVSEAVTYNYRFFYKLIIECSSDPNTSLSDLPGVDALHILDPSAPVPDLTMPNGPMFTYDWTMDSVKRVTGQVDPCVVLSQPACYSIYYYHTDARSPDVTKSFVASMLNCCRPFNSVNINFQPEYFGQGCIGPINTGAVGNGLVNFIVLPPLVRSPINSSPVFTSIDTILSVCINNPFSCGIHATDPDNDSIAYHFGTPRTYARKLTPALGGREVMITMYRTFPEILFKQGYSEQYPAGPSITLDPKSGLLSGNLTEPGTFDVTVNAVEYRAGKLLDSISQDLYIKAYDCNAMTKPKAVIPDSLNNCDGFTLTFPNNSIPQYPGVNFNNTSVLWNFGDGDSSTDFKPVHTYADTGIYNVRLVVFPGLHCADTTTGLAVVYPFVHARFSYNDSCAGQPVTFTNNSTSSSGKITNTIWEAFRNTTLIFNSSDNNAIFPFPDSPKTYHIFLTTRNDKGCVSIDSQYVNIEKSPQPLSFHDTLLSYGATLQLKIDDGNFNQGGQYIWSPSFGLNDPFSPDPILSSTIDETYYVSVINKYGCEMNDSFSVKYYKGPSIYVPNAFTPNGDGKNDIFKPTYIGITELKYFRVFNRNGQLVFETNQQTNGWNGNIYSKPSPEGTYVWEVSGKDYLGKWEVKSGSVVLIK
ncbi:MAG TPA: gliding motility-associated C-terminal domain-containing protein [Puia sp.]|nr:gliding motility-associated C-terminal domain-containing protein [Puia sp.]